MRLRKTLGDRLNATWQVWNARDFHSWWNGAGKFCLTRNLPFNAAKRRPG